MGCQRNVNSPRVHSVGWSFIQQTSLEPLPRGQTVCLGRGVVPGEQAQAGSQPFLLPAVWPGQVPPSVGLSALICTVGTATLCL